VHSKPQFAVAAGATVIATTSSDSKVELLKSLGARHLINYYKTPELGTAVREPTVEKEGVDFVLEVGGVATLAQSLKCVKNGRSYRYDWISWRRASQEPADDLGSKIGAL